MRYYTDIHIVITKPLLSYYFGITYYICITYSLLSRYYLTISSLLLCHMWSVTEFSRSVNDIWWKKSNYTVYCWHKMWLETFYVIHWHSAKELQMTGAVVVISNLQHNKVKPLSILSFRQPLVLQNVPRTVIQVAYSNSWCKPRKLA